MGSPFLDRVGLAIRELYGFAGRCDGCLCGCLVCGVNVSRVGIFPNVVEKMSQMGRRSTYNVPLLEWCCLFRGQDCGGSHYCDDFLRL